MKEKIKEIVKKKKRLIYTSTILATVLIVSLLVYLPFTRAEDSGIFPKQEVEGLSFGEGKLLIENGASRYTVQVENTSDVTKEFTMIEVVFKDESGNEEQIYGYLGTGLSSKEKKILAVSVEEDLTKMTKVEYKIN